MCEKATGTTFLITAEQLGISEEGPGINLMNNFIHALAQQSTVPDSILLVNTGVRLATEASDAFEDLKTMSERGCNILSCGMCLNYYGLTDNLAVGKISNMQEITGILTSAQNAVTI